MFILNAHAEGWVTINGTHVYIGQSGKVTQGPAHMQGKTVKELSAPKKSTSSSGTKKSTSTKSTAKSGSTKSTTKSAEKKTTTTKKATTAKKETTSSTKDKAFDKAVSAEKKEWKNNYGFDLDDKTARDLASVRTGLRPNTSTYDSSRGLTDTTIKAQANALNKHVSSNKMNASEKASAVKKATSGMNERDRNSFNQALASAEKRGTKTTKKTTSTKKETSIKGSTKNASDQKIMENYVRDEYKATWGTTPSDRYVRMTAENRLKQGYPAREYGTRPSKSEIKLEAKNLAKTSSKSSALDVDAVKSGITKNYTPSEKAIFEKAFNAEKNSAMGSKKASTTTKTAPKSGAKSTTTSKAVTDKSLTKSPKLAEDKLIQTGASGSGGKTVSLYTGKTILANSVRKAGVDKNHMVIYEAKDASGKTIKLDGADMGALMVEGIDLKFYK